MLFVNYYRYICYDSHVKILENRFTYSLKVREGIKAIRIIGIIVTAAASSGSLLILSYTLF